MLWISLILGLVITALINRLIAIYYFFISIICGILLLIHYWDSVFPLIQFMIFMIIWLLFFVFDLVFFSCVVVLIAGAIERLIAYLKNKIDTVIILVADVPNVQVLISFLRQQGYYQA